MVNKQKITYGSNLMRLTNYSRQIVYPLIYHDFKGHVPKLGHNRESFESLLMFLLGNVINTCYDGEKHYFRKRFTLQESDVGMEYDAYEMAARTFIGVGYLTVNKEDPDLSNIYLRFISSGVDPESNSFWGRIKSERAPADNVSVIIGLLLNEEKLWNRLPPESRANMVHYILESSKKHFWENNWLWFKVFHYIFLEKYGGLKFQGEVRAVFKKISSFYQGDGWYNDGDAEHETCFDHYNSWAMHYYGLLFCILASDRYEDLKATLRKRFKAFYPNYIIFFNENGLPVAWGRSLTYRFAMVSCLGLGIRLNLIDEGEWPKIKRIVASTINSFFDEGILDGEGILTLGYIKPSKSAIESYSGFGSPYWSLKGFSFLLLDDAHHFWAVEDRGGNEDKQTKTGHYVRPMNVYVQSHGRNHVLMLNGGINSRRFLLKYNRFAYSNIFTRTLDETYIDHAFVFILGGEKIVKDTIHSVSKSGNDILVKWGSSRLKGLEVDSKITPVENGYSLESLIRTPMDLKFVYSGFNMPGRTVHAIKSSSSIELLSEKLKSRIEVIGFDGRLGYHRLSERRNLTGHGSTVPYAMGEIRAGDTLLSFILKACEVDLT